MTRTCAENAGILLPKPRSYGTGPGHLALEVGKGNCFVVNFLFRRVLNVSAPLPLTVYISKAAILPEKEQ
jgi:hypothetical protein